MTDGTAHPARSERCDFLVIGAGIAGASVAYELAAHGRVVILEREDRPGYHTTGRSAALYTETYGNAVMRALTRASRAFHERPPPGFAESPILTPRGTLLTGRADQLDALRRTFDECRQLVPSLQMWSGDEVRRRVPVFSAGQVAAAVWEPEAMDIDVHGLHHGFLRAARARGASLHCRAEVEALERDRGDWRVRSRAGEFIAPIVVNASGAWADAIAALAGARGVGLKPLRRTVVTFDPPAGHAPHAWPAVIDIDERWYFKPDAGRVLASPADETPSPPCDAQPDEFDLAVLVDRIERATTLRIRRLHAKWAGLRNFVADKTLVIGEDAGQPGFFWLAGQGGYGIQTSPAAARAAAALARGLPLPADLRDFGVTASDLSVQRPALAA